MNIVLTLDLIASTSSTTRDAFNKALATQGFEKLLVVTTTWVANGKFATLAAAKASLIAAEKSSGATIQKSWLFEYTGWVAHPAN